MNLVDRDVVLTELAERGYAYNASVPFRLASGETSPEYVDCRQALTLPWLLEAVAGHLLGQVRVKAEAIGGLTMGADPLAIAVSLRHHRTTYDGSDVMGWFSVRKTPKQYGIGGAIIGALHPGAAVIVIDDVVTTGASTIQAIRACRASGLKVRQVLALLDREVGGLPAIRAVLDEDPTSEALPHALFTLSELRAEGQRQRGHAHPTSG